MATRYEPGMVIGDGAGWIVRWVEALGGVAVAQWRGLLDNDAHLDIHVSVPGGRVTCHKGEWIVHDLTTKEFTTMDDATFTREHVTDYIGIGGAE